ncbi:MAG: hypothetical protein HYU39_06960 [Thaumarchaeota archaeon]|nr:hypothetical protein [Nitrososphaerota archaeon]
MKFSPIRWCIDEIIARGTPNQIVIDDLARLATVYLAENHPEHVSLDLFYENQYEFNRQNVLRAKGFYLEDSFDIYLNEHGWSKLSRLEDLHLFKKGYVRLRYDDHSIPDFVIKHNKTISIIEVKNEDPNPVRQKNEEEIDNIIRKFQPIERKFTGHTIAKFLIIPKLKTSTKLKEKLRSNGIQVIETGKQLLWASKTQFKKLRIYFDQIMTKLRGHVVSSNKKIIETTNSLVMKESYAAFDTGNGVSNTFDCRALPKIRTEELGRISNEAECAFSLCSGLDFCRRTANSDTPKPSNQSTVKGLTEESHLRSWETNLNMTTELLHQCLNHNYEPKTT